MATALGIKSSTATQADIDKWLAGENYLLACVIFVKFERRKV